MIKSKTSMIFVVLVLLFAAISLSGCLGGNDNNATPSGNGTPSESTPSENTPSENTPSENSTPSENLTPSENSTPSENLTPSENSTPSENTPSENIVEPTGKVVISTTLDDDDSLLIKVQNKKYSLNSANISTGDTIRIWSREERNFRHILHSEENAFEDFNLNPGYFVYMTFNEAGTYKIDMINFYTGEPHGDSPVVLTVKVV